jgi:peptidoglycan/xylan/chitin deacetylase (PgdA/CDA1 family)
VAVTGGERLIALTFDLCESARGRAGYDRPLVDYLRAQGVPATFYAGGKWMRSHPEETQDLMADPLFELGNHTETHESLRTWPSAGLAAQIAGPQAEYAHQRAALLARGASRGAQGVGAPVPGGEGSGAGAGLAQLPPAAPATFRFPFGVCRAESLAAVAAAGLPAVQWSIVTGDPDPHRGPAEIARTVLQQAAPGAIVVAHANGRGRHTAAALPLLVPELRRRGYRFVTVSELLHAGRPVVTDTCYEQRPGDNARYDQPAHRAARRVGQARQGEEGGHR